MVYTQYRRSMRDKLKILYAAAFLVLLGTAMGSAVVIQPTVTVNTITNSVTISAIITGFPSGGTVNLNASQSEIITIENATFVNAIFNTSSSTTSSQQTQKILTVKAPNNVIITNNVIQNVSTITPLNINKQLNCTGVYTAPAGYNAIIRAPDCKTNLNLTIIPNSTEQVFINSTANQIVRVKPIPMWNLHAVVNASYNQDQIIANGSINFSATFKRVVLGNVTWTETNTTRGYIISNSLYDITYSVIYPQINKVVILSPGQSFPFPQQNGTIAASNLNDSVYNFSKLNQVYYTGANSIFNSTCPAASRQVINGNDFCVQVNNGIVNLEQICTEQQLLDHNLFEGLGGCIANYTREINQSNAVCHAALINANNNITTCHDEVTTITGGAKIQEDSALIYATGFIVAATIISVTVVFVVRGLRREPK